MLTLSTPCATSPQRGRRNPSGQRALRRRRALCIGAEVSKMFEQRHTTVSIACSRARLRMVTAIRAVTTGGTARPASCTHWLMAAVETAKPSLSNRNSRTRARKAHALGQQADESDQCRAGRMPLGQRDRPLGLGLGTPGLGLRPMSVDATALQVPVLGLKQHQAAGVGVGLDQFVVSRRSRRRWRPGCSPGGTVIQCSGTGATREAGAPSQVSMRGLSFRAHPIFVLRGEVWGQRISSTLQIRIAYGTNSMSRRTALMA